jgi:hypothetical protein
MALIIRVSHSSTWLGTQKIRRILVEANTLARSVRAALCAAISCQSDGRPASKCKYRQRTGQKKGPEKKLEEITQVHMVELPRFPDRELGALWVLRTKEGAIELVFSSVQPDHPDWPGRVKGWPEPSLEYRRERWELYRNLAEDSVENNRNLLSGLQAKSQQDLRKSWELHKRYNREEVSEFTGPEDPAFSAYLKKRYVDGLRHSELKLQKILKAKP